MAKLIENEEIRSFIRENAGKMSTDKMSLEIFVSRSIIEIIARDLKVSLIVRKDHEKFEQISDAVSLYHKTHTVRQIADMMEVGVGSVKYHGSLQGVQFKPYTRRQVKAAKVNNSGIFEHSKDTWRI